MSLAESLTEKRKQEAMNQIARAALELILDDGYDATSVEAIAASAGCSPRTVYRYFGTKEDLMFHDLPAVIDQVRHDLARHLEDGVDAWTAVCESLMALSRTVDAAPTDFLAQRMKLWLSEPALRGRYMHYFSECESLIEEALYRHRGTTPDKDALPQLLAVSALGAYRVTLMQHPSAQPGQKRTKILGELLAALRAGFGSEAARTKQMHVA